MSSEPLLVVVNEMKSNEPPPLSVMVKLFSPTDPKHDGGRRPTQDVEIAGGRGSVGERYIAWLRRLDVIEDQRLERMSDDRDFDCEWCDAGLHHIQTATAAKWRFSLAVKLTSVLWLWDIQP